MKKIAVFATILFIPFLANTATSYEIEKSINDETFVINGEIFKAKSYCMNMEVGDRVIFIEGSPHGACSSAKLYNLRTEKTCNVWCE
ncbi:hypothetical protein ACLUYJ_00525 [Acinetobacter baumannii]|uniref:hypothetical protein n=1 Tax=Acinetobacter baumannii TaxID=470 RepID=UPI003991B5D5